MRRPFYLILAVAAAALVAATTAVTAGADCTRVCYLTTPVGDPAGSNQLGCNTDFSTHTITSTDDGYVYIRYSPPGGGWYSHGAAIVEANGDAHWNITAGLPAGTWLYQAYAFYGGVERSSNQISYVWTSSGGCG